MQRVKFLAIRPSDSYGLVGREGKCDIDHIQAGHCLIIILKEGGFLRTSTVQSVQREQDILTVKTRNSVYEFEVHGNGGESKCKCKDCSTCKES